MATPGSPTANHTEHADHSELDFDGDVDPDDFERGLRALTRRAPFRFPPDSIPAHFKQSSVMLCFWRGGDDVHVLLTKRAATLRGHPGQMAFPGGRLEAGEDWRAAALRETEEEVGIPPSSIEILGNLDDAWSGAGHHVVPIVGWLNAAPALIPNPDEVASIHTPTIRSLLAPGAISHEPGDLDGVPFYQTTVAWDGSESGGSVVGFSTDLLLEAIDLSFRQAGIAQPNRDPEEGLAHAALGPSNGQQRLRCLKAWLRIKARETA